MKQTYILILNVVHVALLQGSVGPTILTADRIWAVAAGLLGLLGVIVGGRALARSANPSNSKSRKQGASVALVAGPIAATVGVLLLATADAGPGSGNGVVGAGIALVLGLIASVTGWIGLTRSRHMG